MALSLSILGQDLEAPQIGWRLTGDSGSNELPFLYTFSSGQFSCAYLNKVIAVPDRIRFARNHLRGKKDRPVASR